MLSRNTNFDEERQDSNIITSGFMSFTLRSGSRRPWPAVGDQWYFFRRSLYPALSHQPFLLGCTYLSAEAGFNKVNGLENQLRTAREPLLARCDNALVAAG